MTTSPLTDQELLERLRFMLGRSRDPRLHDAVWSFREGRLSRLDLLTHPAFAAEVRAEQAEALAELERRGGSLAQVQEATREVLAEHEASGDPEPVDGAADGRPGPDLLR